MDYKEMKNKISQRSQKGTEYGLPVWEELTSIPLYMDQTIMYLDGILELLNQEDGDQIITKSMINNYVKDNVLRHPENKKYEKDQLASLISISVLKRVLNIQDISALLQEVGDSKKMYGIFKDAHEAAIHSASDELSKSLASDEDLLLTAIELSAKASAHQWAAREILLCIGKNEKENDK